MTNFDYFEPILTKNWSIDNGYSTIDKDVYPRRLIKYIFGDEDYGIVLKTDTINLVEGLQDWIGYKVKNNLIRISI